jgi:hypothetical protein
MTISQEQRARLAVLADVLIPAGDGMPSASQAEVAGRWLDAVLAARPDLTDRLQKVLATTNPENHPAEAVDALRRDNPAAFEVLAEVIPAAYFMNASVQQALGYAGQGPRPIDPRPDYMENDLLASVIRRGPIFRPTPRP